MITLMMANAERIEAMTKFIELEGELINLNIIEKISLGLREIAFITKDRDAEFIEKFDTYVECRNRYSELKKLLCGDDK